MNRAETRPVRRWPLVVPFGAALTLATGACSDRTPTALESGLSLTVYVSTTGWIPGEAFTLVIDGSTTYRIGLNDHRILKRLSPGTHEVTLQVRPDCRVDQPSRQVVVSGEQGLVFDVLCFGFGSLDVITETSGAAPYGSHWLVLEIGEWEVPLAANGATAVTLLAGQHGPGFYPAPNCTSSSSFRVVQVYPDETTELRLEAACTPAGTASATLVPTGTDVPNAVLWDVTQGTTGAGKRLLLQAGRATDIMLAEGDWTGQFVELPPNCVATNDDPVHFSVAAQDTVAIAPGIDCTPYLGSLQLTLTSDTPAVWLSVNRSCETFIDVWNDDCYPALTPNGVTNFPIAAGTYSIHVSAFPATGIACAITPADPITVEIRTAMVTEVAFTVSCVPGDG